MALSEATISLDLNQILGDDFASGSTKVRVYTNVVNQTLMDTSTGETRLGDQAVEISDDGTGTFTTWCPGVDGNPVSWQTYVEVKYRRRPPQSNGTRTFGPYTIEAANDGDNLTDLEDEQAIPPNYQTAFTEAAQAYLDAQAEIAGIDDTDSAVAALIEDELVGPLTNAALSASYGAVKLVTDPQFGVAADDTTDDTAALQAALTSAASLGFALVVPDGKSIRITSTLAAVTGGRLVGSGRRGGSVLRLDTSTATQHVISGSSVSDFGIVGMTIDGGYGGGHTAGSGVRLIGSTDCLIEGNFFRNVPDNTVLIRDASVRCTVRNNHFEIGYGGAGHIYLLTDVTDTLIEGNFFEDSFGGCIWLSGRVLRTRIVNNECAQSTYELIGIRYDCELGEIIGNVARRAGDNGISVTGSGFTVAGNVCVENDHAGITVYGSHNTVTGNICRDNGKAGLSQYGGLQLMAAWGAVCANNTITGNIVERKNGLASEQYYGIRFFTKSYTDWATSQTIAVGDYRVVGPRLYVATTAGTTGATAPTHTTGTASDGAVTWSYLDSFADSTCVPIGNRVGNNIVTEHAVGTLNSLTGNDLFDRVGSRRTQIDADPWVTATAVLFGDVRTSVASTGQLSRYRATTSGTTGATAPTHTSGSASDGAVTWYYLGTTKAQTLSTADTYRKAYRTRVGVETNDSAGTFCDIIAGTGSPEGNVTAANGSIYLRSNSLYGIQIYVKTGTTNTAIGWRTLQYRDSGTTANRPTGLGGGNTGQFYFDTTLGKPIWWKTAGWVDATGASV